MAAESVRAAIAAASEGLVERGALVELIALAAVAREHVLVVGPPGTAKSEAVRRIARALGGAYFEYLLGRFTEPSEIFGPVDLRRLREGVIETETTGMLPEAEIAFLDEVFLGSTAILNTLLGLLNERTFRRGHTRIRVPLRVCVGASNAVPDDPALSAFADRFLLRVTVDAVPDPQLEDLLVGGAKRAVSEPVTDMAAIDALADAAEQADLTAVRPHVATAVRKLRSAGVPLSDRRVVKLQRLIAAAATLAGRAPGPGDLWPIVFAVPDPAGQELARDVLKDLLARSDNAVLGEAAELASLGPLARGRRLAEAGEALLASPEDDRETWQLRIEGVLREIDASFPQDALPSTLGDVRGRLAAALPASP